MDKKEPLMKTIKKYDFWALCVAIPLIAFGTTFYVNGTLDKAAKKRKSEIQRDKSTANNLARQSLHPNQAYLDGMDQRIQETRKRVERAWQIKYEKQGTKTFVWNPEGIDDDLKFSPEFCAAVKNLRPIETKVPYPPKPGEGEILESKFREQYQNTIAKRLPQLAKMIGAHWHPDDADPATKKTGAETTKKEPPIVEWDADNQFQLLHSHFDWRNSRGDPVRPTTAQVLYAQEDYWVMQSLMNIILRTNLDPKTGKNVTAAHKANISRIKYIYIGKDIQEQAKRGGSKRKRTGRQLQSRRNFVRRPSGIRRGSKPTTGTTPKVETDPAEGRYVDMENKPLSTKRLRGTSQSGGLEGADLAVAKRIPVHIEVVMDEREVERLLVECGNSPLALEIQKVRLKPRNEATMHRGGAAPTVPHGEKANHYMRPVEIYGIISIYNPVNRASLGFAKKKK